MTATGATRYPALSSRRYRIRRRATARVVPSTKNDVLERKAARAALRAPPFGRRAYDAERGLNWAIGKSMSTGAKAAAERPDVWESNGSPYCGRIAELMCCSI